MTKMAELELQTPEKYIILPGRTHETYSYQDLLVAMEKSHFNKTWYQTHKELQKEKAHMLTIRQYIDLIELLKSGKVHNGKGKRLDKTTIDKLLDEILAKRDPWRAEWLDAYFEQRKDGLYILTENKTKPEKLEQYLMEDCYVDISSANKQGLLTKKSRSKEVYFWYPRAERVARFGAGSDWANLYCLGDPQYLDSRLGVRVVRTKNFEPKEEEKLIFINPFEVDIPEFKR